jgi:hypothetical protein
MNVQDTIVVGTYNMSFASDKGWMPEGPNGIGTFQHNVKSAVVPSEAPFLRSNIDEDRRKFWKNALEHLKKFIEEHKPLAVGLQEMNLTTPKEKTERGELYGTSAVEKMLETFEEDDKYKIISREVNMNKAGISLILKIKEAGNEIKTEIYDNLNQENGPAPNGGRPILMHLTDKDYLFISMHGAQDGTLGRSKDKFDEYMVKNNKQELEEKVNAFLHDENGKPVLGGRSLKAIYVMGDFNDRYDAIKEFVLKIDNEEFFVNYTGDSPLSCCYNYNSMSKNDQKVKIFADETVEVDYYQGPDDTETKKKHTDDDGIIMEVHGRNIEHYLNKGDKVFAWPTSGPLKIFYGGEETHINNPSDKSDHELVYMSIPQKTERETEAAAASEGDETKPALTNEELIGGKKKTKKRKSSKKKTKKRKGKRKGGTKKLNTTHKK